MNGASAGYARALFNAAAERGVLERVSEELGQLESIFAEHAHFFSNPAVPSSRQACVLRDILDGRADELTIRFLERLAQDRQMKQFSHIRKQYDRLVEAELKAVSVLLRVRDVPSENLMRIMREDLAQWGLFPVEKKDTVVFEVVIDKNILGGFIAECRGRMIDASLRTRLARLYTS